MGQLSKEIFICMDCETTGLDPVQDRIVEVAIVRFTLDCILDQYEMLINPQHPISEVSLSIHHITQEMVADKPTIEQELPKILEFMGDHIVVGHGIAFDVQLLINAAQRANMPCKLQDNRLLDTLRLARLYGESPVNSLERLRHHFNIQSEGAHRAMGDVLVNIEVFKNLVRNFKTTQEVFEALSRPIMFKTMPLGPHKGRLIKDVPLSYLLWAANKDFDQDLLFTIRSELKKRKKGNLFTQATNPFNDL